MNSSNSALLDMRTSADSLALSGQSRVLENNSNKGGEVFAPELQRQTAAHNGTAEATTEQLAKAGNGKQHRLPGDENPLHAESRTSTRSGTEKQGAFESAPNDSTTTLTAADEENAEASAALDLAIDAKEFDIGIVVEGPIKELSPDTGKYFPPGGNFLPPVFASHISTIAAEPLSDNLTAIAMQDSGFADQELDGQTSKRGLTDALPFRSASLSFSEFLNTRTDSTELAATKDTQLLRNTVFAGTDIAGAPAVKSVSAGMELFGLAELQTTASARTLLTDSDEIASNGVLANPDKLSAARLPPASEAAASTTLRIVSPAGTAEWTELVGDRIRWMNKADIASADLKLHPAELGSIEIKIITEDQQTRVSFITSNAAAKDMIEATLPRLREMLLNNGLQLEQSDISNQQGAGGNSHRESVHNTQPSVDEREMSLGQLAVSEKRPSGQIDHYV